MYIMMMLGCTDVLCFTTHLNSDMFFHMQLEFWLEVCKYTIIILTFYFHLKQFLFESLFIVYLDPSSCLK